MFRFGSSNAFRQSFNCACVGVGARSGRCEFFQSRNKVVAISTTLWMRATTSDNTLVILHIHTLLIVHILRS